MLNAKRILAFLLCIVMVVSLFGCVSNSDTNDSETQTESHSTESESQTESSEQDASNDVESESDIPSDINPETSDSESNQTTAAEKETGNSATQPAKPSIIPEDKIPIAELNNVFYRIVYEEALPPIVKSRITKNVNTVSQKTGANIEVFDDAALPAPTDGIPEILIGKTNRDESGTASATLRTGEFKIFYSEDTRNIIIAAAGSSALCTAIDRFFKDNLNTTERYLALSDAKYEAEKILDFPIQSVAINGVPIQEYVIVHSSSADLITKYAALNLADYLERNMGVKLDVITDSKAEQKYEFLVGKTRRSASTVSTTLKDGQYVLVEKNGKIVMQGNGIYVGAAVGAFVSKYLPATGNKKIITIDNLTTTAKAQTYTFPSTFKNAIILIGDGMGFNHIEMAKNGGMKEFYAEQFPNKGQAVTRSLSVINGDIGYTDSAAAATALATGYKTLNSRVGVDKNGNTLKNIRELADGRGAKTAVVTTDVIGGATPGGFLAHNAQRKVNDVTNPDIIKEIDDLIAKKKVEYTMGREYDSVNAPNPDILEGTREALALISAGGDQFFMMVEAAYIDKDSHNNRYDQCVNSVKQYNEVIAYLSTFVFCHPSTVLIVTADHETGELIKTTDTSTYKYGYKYTSGSSSYRQHTNKNVPVFAIGPKTEYFNGYEVENVCIPHFAAQAYGNSAFGDPTYTGNRTKI